MSGGRLVVDLDDDGGVRVQTNLRKLDACYYPPIFAALAAHLGLNPRAMRKAVEEGHGGGEPLDPRYPHLAGLIRRARADWRAWGDDLVLEVSGLLERGELLPMSPEAERALFDLLRDNQVKISSRMCGGALEYDRLSRLIAAGVVDPEWPGFTQIAWRLGRSLDPLEVPRPAPAHREPELSTMLRQAVAVELTEQDQHALDYIRRRGLIYATRPANRLTGEIARSLNDSERARQAAVLERAVAGGWSRSKAISEMREAVQGTPSILSDMDRLVRTELAYAHNHGALVSLRAAAAAAGEDDPEVYKFVAAGSCRQCKRIWGPPGNPNRYRLSFILEREAAGGNVGLPKSQWGPVVGPVHPNCTEGPLQYYKRELVESINTAADEFMAFFGE